MDTVSATGSMLRGAWALPSIRTAMLPMAIVVFVAIGVVPVLYMLSLSITDAAGSFSLENYRELFSDSRRRELLLTSGVLGTGTAMLATMLGAPLGLLLARTSLPAKQLLRILLVVPLVMPPYVMALAWILMTGPVGVFAKVMGQDFLSSWTYSLTGAIVVLAFSFYPLPMLAAEAAARRVDGRLEEAALLVS